MKQNNDNVYSVTKDWNRSDWDFNFSQISKTILGDVIISGTE